MYKVYLCHQLAAKGFHCYLGSKSNIYYLQKTLKGYIYFDKGYHKGTSEKIHELVKQNNGIIVSLDEEGGVDYADGSTLLGRYSKKLFNNADLIFMWGEKQLELVKSNMNEKNKVVITGHPRFELLKPEFHKFYQDEVDKINNKFKKFILINTNMGFGNNIRGDDFVKSNYRGRFKNIDQIIDFDKKKIGAFCSLILNLSQQLNKTIVLRPHPEEDHSYYLDAFNGIKNVRVVYEGSVIPWLLATDLMIHPDCTTAIESLFIGKKPISFLPSNYPKELVTHLPLESSECFTSKSELILYINNNLGSIKNVDLRNYPFAENYFSISKPSTDFIVNHICRLTKKVFNKKKTEWITFSRGYLKYLTFKSKYSPRASAKLSRNKLKGFFESEICRINNNILIHRDQNSGKTPLKITDSLFLFK